MPEYLRSLLRRPPIGWWDVLDILIVSFLIYEFLKLIRGTRAVQMAAGSLLIVGLFRALTELYQGETWASWLTLGGIFVAFGGFLWAKRHP